MVGRETLIFCGFIVVSPLLVLCFGGVPCLGLVSGSFRDFLAKLRVGEGLLMRTYSLLSAGGFWRVVVLNFHGRTEMMLRRSGG